MSRLSYSAYLLHELNAVQHALLKALEEYDRKMYIEAPLLDKEYMSKIGNVEQEIVSLELDVFFLNRKIELIQTDLFIGLVLHAGRKRLRKRLAKQGNELRFCIDHGVSP